MQHHIGDLLDIDLSKHCWTRSSFPKNAAAQVFGGRGWNAWYLYHHLPATLAPSSPDNILLFSNGLLTGTRIPTSSRVHVSALSPQTGLLGSSNVGGDFGAALRACRIQSIIIRGQSASPVYLVIEPDAISLRDASVLWGLDTWETEDALQQQFQNPHIHCMMIGPGAENGAVFGCVMSDRDHAAGRTGMGTVMGNKHLKAIVVIPPEHESLPPQPTEVKEAVSRYIRQIRQAREFETVSRYGGAGQVVWADDLGLLPTHNYQDNHFAGITQLDGQHLAPDIVKRRGCRRCPVQCKAHIQFHTGKYAGNSLARPEFESVLAFGPKCGVDELDTVVYLDTLCSRLGLDSISTGGTIAFAMDLFKRGMITTVDTEGLTLKWGDGEVMETLIRQMAYQQGFGRILSQGVCKAAELIGNGAKHFAPHVKGLELSAYNPREIMGTALGYAVASRGGDYSHVYPSLEYRWSPEKAQQIFQTPCAVDVHATQGKGALLRWTMIVNAVMDSLGVCKVPALGLLQDFDLKREAELTSALLQQDIMAEELFAVGERIATIERLFNLRHGATAEDDTLPPLFMDGNGRRSIPIAAMVQDFYSAMSWNTQGVPSQSVLQKFDLEV
jgi:aldehyde:ferredoxin oxidoreductase